MDSPKHLKGIFKPTDKDGLEGKIICECGCEAFGLKYFGEPYKGYIRVEKHDGKYALVIKAVCGGCGKEWLLFDFAKHAYNGLICADGISVPDSELKNFSCGEDDLFGINMSIEIDDEEQFLEEIVDDPPEGMSFTPDDRFDIWDWVVINLKGAKSGKEINFVNEELA